jgi:hypothetical protein
VWVGLGVRDEGGREEGRKGGRGGALHTYLVLVFRLRSIAHVHRLLDVQEFEHSGVFLTKPLVDCVEMVPVCGRRVMAAMAAMAAVVAVVCVDGRG